MKLRFTILASLSSLLSLAQGEVVNPLLINPYIYQESNQYKAGNTIDSTFIYNIDTLDLPVWDDFSVSKFIPYNSYYTDGNVSSQIYYHLMNSTNTVPQNPSFIFCDSSHAHHDTISVVAGIPTTTTDYFPTPVQVWVNDLTAMPVTGLLRTLYQECYVLIDSIIDGVPDPDQDTVFYTILPDFVQDSAQVFTVDYSDPTKIWVDSYAYHNYTYAINPWSLGVATLDGVDENGWPYDFGNENAHESADVLTSRPINLFGKTNVYLTFLYQAKGNGNAPEINDTLMLDFWVVDSNKWMPSGWYVLGATTNDTWDTVHWALPTAVLDDGFQFRFRNWASTSGALDHWHIDYVNLKDNDLPIVSNFSDLAISEPIHSFLDEYTSVPWDHFQNPALNQTDKMLDTLKLKVYNSNITPTNFANGSLEIAHQGLLQGGSPYTLANPAITSEWTGNWEIGMNKYPYPVQANYTFDETVTTSPQATFVVKLNIDAAVSASNVYDVNDTTYHTQAFKNYYSYDDGSAEAAYGITGSHSLLAYKFTAYEEDTLAGILMHFVPSVDDHSDEIFLLTIWDDNAGQPGTIIYQDDYFNTHSPEYSGALNGFKYYTFMNGSTVVVPETFYVGWEQIGSTSLNVGMDHNIDNGDKIYRNVSGTWVTSSYESSLLIRPVFSTGLNYTLSSEPITEPTPELATLSIYPNPVTDILTIQTDATVFTVTLYDMSGRVVLTTYNETQLDLSFLNAGIYLADIRDANGVSLYSGKLIKE